MERTSDEEFLKIVNESVSVAECLRKLGYPNLRPGNYGTFHRRCKRLDISTSHFAGQASGGGGVKLTPLEDILVKDSNFSNIRRRLLKEGLITDDKCQICDITSWNGGDLPLVLDHINGNNRDNRLENLRMICRNCDGQLDTYTGRRPKKKATPCIDCGIETKAKKSIRCKPCSDKSRRDVFSKIEWPCSCELESDRLETSYQAVGRRLKVTGNSVKKRIKNHPCYCQ